MFGRRQAGLTYRQAARCENAKTARCICRCGGKAHGKGRVAPDAARADYERLAQEDPHHVEPKRWP